MKPPRIVAVALLIVGTGVALAQAPSEQANGKPDGEAVQKTCFGCHAPAKDRDFVFTRYSR